MKNTALEKISVVVPVYNAELFIEECVNSILNQTYSFFELIIVNDGSKDSSPEIIQRLSALDSRILVVSQANQGVSAARNAGIQKASGDYICFVDADDIVMPDYLSNMINQIGDNDALFEGFRYLYPNGNVVDKKLRLPSRQYDARYVFDSIVDDGTLSGILLGSVCGALYKSSVIRSSGVSFPSQIKVNEDGIFNIDYLLHASSFIVIPELDYYYRQWNTDSKPFKLKNTDLENSTEYIEQNFGDLPGISEQLNARTVSVLFWICIDVMNAAEGLFQCAGLIRKSDISATIKKNFQYLNKNKTSKYKLFLVWLIKNRLYFSFVFIMKMIVPRYIDKVKH